MAKSPTTLAGAYPLPDLLFSPRAAFIWNHTRKSVAWMNPAARAAFTLRLEDFSAAIPTSLVRRFSQIAAKRESGFVKVKVAGVPPLACSVEILNLADGEEGVIVAELGEGEEPRPQLALSLPSKQAKLPRKTVRKAPTKAPRQAAPKAPPTLTADEMRAFKAVGRKVLRRCADKKRSEKPPAPACAPIHANCEASPEQPAPALANILAAFDLVLFLSDDLDISEMKGRPVRLGWRKANLTGKSVTDILPSYDRGILRRMLKKLRDQPARCSAATLAVAGENGNEAPFRAILGRAPASNTAFFLAFISLDLPPRLKKPQPAKSVTRLAA